MKLSNATLNNLPANIQRPQRRADASQIGIVHIGVGNFHRSHQAMYVDRYLAMHPDEAWAISGAGVRKEDAFMAEGMHSQDCLYSLSLFGSDGGVATSVVGSIVDYLFCPDNPEAVLRRMAEATTKIVSLTVTESGYPEDRSNGRTVESDMELMADIENGLQTPTTAFGLVVAALRHRRERGIAPFTIVSCDNIQHNGDVTRDCVLATARLVDSELASWIEENVAFPSSMVDRITPRATSAQLAKVVDNLGFEDPIAVVAEPFEQWVVEDNFPIGRPRLEEVGVTFVDSVAAYESMKLRLLNGAHQLLAYLGIVAGHTYAHEAIMDPHIAEAVSRYSRELALTTLELPDGVDGEDYIQTLRERFANPAMADALDRLGTDSVSRMAKFVLPTLTEARHENGYLEIVPEILAAWFEVLRTTDSKNILADAPAELLEQARGGASAGDVLASAQWFLPLREDTELLEAVEAAHAKLLSSQE